MLESSDEECLLFNECSTMRWTVQFQQQCLMIPEIKNCHTCSYSKEPWNYKRKRNTFFLISFGTETSIYLSIICYILLYIYFFHVAIIQFPLEKIPLIWWDSAAICSLMLSNVAATDCVSSRNLSKVLNNCSDLWEQTKTNTKKN